MSTENDPRSEHIYAHPYFLRGVEHQKAESLALAKKAHPAIHNESPRPLCPVCVMISKLEETK